MYRNRTRMNRNRFDNRRYRRDAINTQFKKFVKEFTDVWDDVLDALASYDLDYEGLHLAIRVAEYQVDIELSDERTGKYAIREAIEFDRFDYKAFSANAKKAKRVLKHDDYISLGNAVIAYSDEDVDYVFDKKIYKTLIDVLADSVKGSFFS